MDLCNGDIAFMVICTTFVFLMTPGLAFFYGGLVKRKNVLNTMLSSFIVMGLASVLWVLIGYSLSFSGNIGGVIGNLNWVGLSGVGAEAGPYADSIPNLLFAAFQMMFALITPALITGAVAERMKFGALVLFLTLWSFIVYYPMAHMVWGQDGFLQLLGSVDFAGGNVVHISSGVSALVLCIILGKRKFHGQISYHPHNVPFVLLGAALLWFGWFGFNAGSSLAADGLAVHALVVTNISSAAAMLSWLAIEWLKNGRPTAVGAATGAVIGLVAITPGAGFVPIWASIIIGALASPICYFSIAYIKQKLGYDDALDVFGCHGIGGIWGGIATGLFAQKSINAAAGWDGLVFGETGLFTAQLMAIGVTIAVAVIGTFVAAGITRLVTKLRVSDREEQIGLDTAEHSEHAYPAFNGLD